MNTSFAYQHNPLGEFMLRAADDRRLLPTHISLYAALYRCWQNQLLECPFSISRARLMRYGKLSSIATYHKCMRELDAWGYIRYVPSYHPFKGSLVYWPEGLVEINEVPFSSIQSIS